MLLEGKVVVVSGVGPGLGREIAAAAAREGASVMMGARTEARRAHWFARRRGERSRLSSIGPHGISPHCTHEPHALDRVKPV